VKHDQRTFTRCALCCTDDRPALVEKLARDMFESRCDGTHWYTWGDYPEYRAIYRGFAGVLADSIDADRHGRCLLCTSNDREGLTEAVGQALWDSRRAEEDIAWVDAGWWREKYAMLAGAGFASLEGRAF
jgi:hypothetical protein